MININDFKEEKSCIYKGEEYLVRDNGAVLRKSRPGQRHRKLDDEWTFGTQNETGYLVIGKERVHRIVATAFHGEPPTKEYIADHIDTNRHNNRPGNLRWVTKLENSVLNEITREKIEFLTGVSIFEFLKNPSLYRDLLVTPDLSWMRRVTEEEAKACVENVTRWAKRKTRHTVPTSSKIGEWIYQPHANSELTDSHAYVWQEDREDDKVTGSLTPMAKQKDWLIPTDFVCCPDNKGENPIQSYWERLSEGIVFSTNRYGDSKIVKKALVDDNAIVAITAIPSAVKPFALVRITYENGYYLHTNLGSFFSDIGAKKHFTLEQGLEWTGGECIDDYC